MEVKLNLNKTVEQNAEHYFDKAKKYKKKLPGIMKTIEQYRLKAVNLQEEQKTKIVKVPARKKLWYEKFRWFNSSDGFLVIGGRDATTNDIIIKKHAEPHDVVFHTELPGSPFVIIKNNDAKEIPASTLQEAAEFCASYSKSWKSGRMNAEVYHINPDQLSKEAPSGMAGLAKGSFMVNGKRNFMDVMLNIGICNVDGMVMAGPLTAIKNASDKYVEIIPGDAKLSDVAKSVQKIIGGDLDEIIRALPPGCMIRKQKK